MGPQLCTGKWSASKIRGSGAGTESIVVCNPQHLLTRQLKMISWTGAPGHYIELLQILWASIAALLTSINWSRGDLLQRKGGLYIIYIITGSRINLSSRTHNISHLMFKYCNLSKQTILRIKGFGTLGILVCSCRKGGILLHSNVIYCQNQVLSLPSVTPEANSIAWHPETLSAKSYGPVNRLWHQSVLHVPLHSARPAAVTAQLCCNP